MIYIDSTCQLWSPTRHRCYLHDSPIFGDVLNIVTASLIAIGVLFDVIVLFLVKDLELYGDPPDDAYRPIAMQNMAVPPNQPTSENDAVPNNTQRVTQIG